MFSPFSFLFVCLFLFVCSIPVAHLIGRVSSRPLCVFTPGKERKGKRGKETWGRALLELFFLVVLLLFCEFGAVSLSKDKEKVCACYYESLKCVTLVLIRKVSCV